MAEYDPAEPGDAYAPVVNADGTVQVDGELFDAPGAVSTFRISRDRGYDLVAGCPVFMYPHGRDVRVCRLYSNGNGLLPGSVRLPIECIPSWEWQRRVCVPSLHLRATRNQDGDDWISIRLEFLRRIVDRYPAAYSLSAVCGWRVLGGTALLRRNTPGLCNDPPNGSQSRSAFPFSHAWAVGLQSRAVSAPLLAFPVYAVLASMRVLKSRVMFHYSAGPAVSFLGLSAVYLSGAGGGLGGCAYLCRYRLSFRYASFAVSAVCSGSPPPPLRRFCANWCFESVVARAIGIA